MIVSGSGMRANCKLIYIEDIFENIIALKICTVYWLQNFYNTYKRFKKSILRTISRFLFSA